MKRKRGYRLLSCLLILMMSIPSDIYVQAASTDRQNIMESASVKQLEEAEPESTQSGNENAAPSKGIESSRPDAAVSSAPEESEKPEQMITPEPEGSEKAGQMVTPKPDESAEADAISSPKPEETADNLDETALPEHSINPAFIKKERMMQANTDGQLEGDGTENSPYLIHNATELAKVSEDLSAYYELSSDIDLEKAEWTPIGTYENPFTGHFNGNGHVIENYTITGTNYYIGFFGVISNANISSLTLEDFTVSGRNYVGGFVGLAKGENPQIQDCHTQNGKVTGEQFVGGLIGCTDLYVSSSITNCSSDASITGKYSYIGGLTGYQYNGGMEQCCFTGRIESTGQYIGGLTGYIRNGLSFKECYSSGKINSNSTSGTYVGGLFGYIDSCNIVKDSFSLGTLNGNDYVAGIAAYINRSFTIENCYSAIAIYGTSHVAALAQGMDVTVNHCYYDGQKYQMADPLSMDCQRLSVSMTNSSNYQDWDFNEIWRFGTGTTYPYLRNVVQPEDIAADKRDISGEGTVDNPFLIYNRKQLELMRYQLSACYELAAGINLENSEWKPIGTSSCPFTGTFDGKNYKITNLRISNSQSYNGFFAATKNAQIRNVQIFGTSVYGTDYVGGLIGFAAGEKSVIDNCHIQNENLRGNSYVGGLFGYGDNAMDITVTGCSIDAEIIASGSYSNAGGIAGLFSCGGFRQCSFSGNIKASGRNVGGLTGYISQAAMYEECYSNGNITGGYYTGGLIGFVGTTVNIKNSFSKGCVSGSYYVTGVIGYCNNGAVIENCYAADQISGSNYTAGIYNGKGTIKNSYYDSSISGKLKVRQTQAAKDTKSLLSRSTFSQWDFTSVWQIQEGKSYPYLMNISLPEEVLLPEESNINIEGTGTENDPYRIRTAQHLKFMGTRLSAYFKLMNNIDLGGTKWIPVGTYDKPFTGHLDGSGYTVSNFYVNHAENYTGFFAYIASGGTVSDFTLKNGTVTGLDYTGVLCGLCYANNNRECITNCHVLDSNVTGNSYVGGLMGQSSYTALKRCCFTGTVSASQDYAGGLAGYASGSTSAENCFSLGAVTGREYVAGLMGYSSWSSITNSFASMKIEGRKYVGGLYTSSCTVKSSYYDAELCQIENNDSYGYDMDRLTQSMLKKSNYQEWDFKSIWNIEEDTGYPYLKGMEKPYKEAVTLERLQGDGTQNNPYLIYTKDQLCKMRYEMSSSYKLMSDIDMEGESWKPLGCWERPFLGGFNGNGFTISNYKISNNSNYTGFFAVVYNVAIENLTLSSFTISGSGYTGGIAGYSKEGNTQIRNCKVKNGTIQGNSYVGGLIGTSARGLSMEHCCVDFAGQTISGYNYTGGLIGVANYSKITQSYVYGNITSTGSYVGGLAGENYYSCIQECYFSGNISGASTNIGGLVGYQYGNNTSVLENCFALGTVKGYGGVSGLAGTASNGSYITNCYASVKITGDYDTAGICCSNTEGDNNYYDSEICGPVTIAPGGRDRMTSEMKRRTNYQNWNFNTIWSIVEGKEYPYLKNIKKPDLLETNNGSESFQLKGKGTKENPYLIYKKEQLKLMKYQLSSCYQLMSDIDLEGEEWMPLASEKNPFTGTLLGNYHKIVNMKINWSKDNAGLFAAVKDASFEHLTFENPNVSGTNCVGILSGMIMGTKTSIVQCKILNGEVHGTYRIGGYTGYMEDGFLDHSYFTGSVICTGNASGGLTGEVRSGSFTQCYVDAEVTGSDYTGGLAGYSYSEGSYADCFMLGKVTGRNYSGGLVGNSYYSSNTITNCYTAAEIKGKDYIYGISNDSASIVNSYYDAEKGKALNVGKYDTDRLTKAMVNRSNYQDWDFSSIWSIDEKQSYPYLKGLDKPNGVRVATLTIEGDGTKENPYLIRNAEQLKLMNYHLSAYFKLMNDINLQGNAWTPIGSYSGQFKGNLDGNNHIVSNYIVKQDSNYSGLFAAVSHAVISNLILKDFTVNGSSYTGGFAGYVRYADTSFSNCHIVNGIVTGDDYCGGLAGYADDGVTCQRCSVTGTVTGRDAQVGGLIGYLENGTVKECYSNSTIKAVSYVGGLIGGQHYSPVIEDCFSLGTVTGTYDVSGIAGYSAGSSCCIKNCYSAAEVTGSSSVGGLYYGTATVTDSFYDGERSEKITVVPDDTDRLTARMKKKQNYSGWNFSSVWTMEEGKSYPYLQGMTKPEAVMDNHNSVSFSISGSGTLANPYLIRNSEQLQVMDGQLSAYYKLVNSIDLQGIDWIPLANKDTKFTGSLNGNGYTISNLTVSASTDYAGLFAGIKNAVIENLILDTPVITGNSYVGSIAGYGEAENNKIISCQVSNGSISGQSYVGGIGGIMYSVSFDKTSFTGTVRAKSNYTGGFSGYIDKGEFNQCYSDCNVSGIGYVGGICGEVYSDTVCKDCFVLGELTASYNAGGITGTNYYTQKIINSYSAAKITCPSYISGLGSSAELQDSFYDAEQSKIINTGKYDADRLTSAMVRRSNYTSWDFDSVWTIDEGTSYPYLRTLKKPEKVKVSSLSIEGTGTEEKPYLIREPNQIPLMSYHLRAVYALMNDIDMDGETMNPVASYEAPFRGVFKGNGFTVSNMIINHKQNYTGFYAAVNNAVIENLTLKQSKITGAEYTGGLIGFIREKDTTVTNCHILDCDITGSHSIGGLVGYAERSMTMDSCSSNGEIHATGSYCGGLAGHIINGASIRLSVFTGKISDTGNYIGGIAGYSYNLQMDQCYSSGEIDGINEIGGLIGELTGYSEISNSFSLGTIKGTSNVYGIAGYCSSSNKITNCYSAAKLTGTSVGNGISAYGIVTNSYYDAEASGAPNTTSMDIDRVTESMTSMANYIGWDFNSVWDMDEGLSYPYLINLERPSNVLADLTSAFSTMDGDGSQENPYIIRNAKQLRLIGYELSAYYKLANDIDLNNIRWTPAGSYESPFTGGFDGAGHTVSNVLISRNMNSNGFFAAVKGAMIKDLTLRSCTVTGKKYTGGLIGYIEGDTCTLSNCHLFDGNITGTCYTGGLIGYSGKKLSISNCSFRGEVNGTEGDSYAGGIIGYSHETEMEQCNFCGSVKASGNYAGGLFGCAMTGTVKESFADADVSGKQFAGGLMGYIYNDMEVKDCYALGNVTGTDYAGGIAGYSRYDSCSFTDCYASVSLKAENKEGGIYSGTARVTSCYYDAEESGMVHTNPCKMDRMTKEMVKGATYKNWNFESIWAIDEGAGYPYLKNMDKPEAVTADQHHISFTLQGNGTEEEPYQIENKEQFALMNAQLFSCYQLVNDIDFNGAFWTPTGNYEAPFTGCLDGQGHTVTNCFISENGMYTGFFGAISNAEIKNITFQNGNLKGTDYTGYLAGYQSGENTLVTNCAVRDSIVKGTSHTGGLFGYISQADMEQCHFTGEVNASRSYSGGIAGDCYTGKLKQCSCIGKVAGDSYAGGIFGYADGEILLEDSFAISTITGNSSVSGLAGYSNSDNNIIRHCYAVPSFETSKNPGGIYTGYAKIEDSYYDSQVSGVMDSTEKDMDRLTGAMLTKDNYTGWNFDSIWNMEEGTCYPYLRTMEKPQEVTVDYDGIKGTGTSEDPYLISKAEQLKLLNYQLGAHFKLINDIDVKNGELEPAASFNSPFRGQLDGNNYKISNYTMESGSQYTGLFRAVKNAVIKNLTLENFKLTGSAYTGAITGYSSGTLTKFKNCHVNSGTIEGDSYTGSIAGVSSGEMEKCGSDSYIIGNGDYTGGLAGRMYEADVNQSYFAGTVKAAGSYTGGLSGNAYNGIAKECYSSGNIKAAGYRVGGLFGYIKEISITDCFAAGKVEGGSSVAGLIGYSYASESNQLKNSYAAAKVSGESDLGGLFNGALARMTNSYYDAEKCKILNTTKEDIDRLTGACLAKDNYCGWNFDLIWEMDEGKTYPFLKALEKPEDMEPVGERAIEGIGDGMNPYLISTEEQLELISYQRYGYYELTEDLDLHGKIRKPIGSIEAPFCGTIFGEYHTISNFTINQSTSNAGFFAAGNKVSIYDLNLDNFSVTGADNVGGLIGNVKSPDSELYNCNLTHATITGQNCVGGIAGVYNGDMSECTFEGSVHAAGSCAGGGAGQTTSGITYHGCTVIGKITGKDQVQAYPGGGNYGDTENVFTGCAGAGTVSNPYELQGITGLHYIKEDPSGCYSLTGDINANGETFAPIGTEDKPFSGTFDGNGHTISNLDIVDETGNGTGFFGHTNGASIKRIRFDNVKAEGKDHNYVGIIADENDTESISFYDCHITNSKINAASYVGSFIGKSNGPVSIELCSSDAEINVTGDYIGGLAGSCQATISQSCFTGTINGTGNYIGGLLGTNRNSEVSSITDCYAIGELTGNEYIGGIVGQAGGNLSLKNVYAAEKITGNLHVGGLDGAESLSDSNTISCYYDRNVSKLPEMNSWSRTTRAMLKKSNFAGWEFGSIWTIDEDETYPYFIYSEKPKMSEITGIVVEGNVTDAKTKELLGDATILIRQGANNQTGDVTDTIVTNGEGHFVSFMLSAGTYTFEIIRDGYITEYKECTLEERDTDLKDFSIMPRLSATQISIKLSWKNVPADLDAHLIRDGEEIYFPEEHKTGIGTSLDRDDQHEYGTETITLDLTQIPKVEFRYFVRWFGGESTWEKSGATVNVYRGNELVYIFTPPAALKDGAGSEWNVFTYDASKDEIKPE